MTASIFYPIYRWLAHNLCLCVLLYLSIYIYYMYCIQALNTTMPADPDSGVLRSYIDPNYFVLEERPDQGNPILFTVHVS